MSDESDYRNSWIGGGRGTGPLNYPPLDEQYKSRDATRVTVDDLYDQYYGGKPIPGIDVSRKIEYVNPQAFLVDTSTGKIEPLSYQPPVANRFDEGKTAPAAQATRFDEAKTLWSLLDWDFVEEITRGLMYGAKKYTDPYNYQKGLSYSRVFRAAMSHLTKWWRGTEIDEESGVHHLALAACNLMFAFYYTKRATKYGEKFDDRPPA